MPSTQADFQAFDQANGVQSPQDSGGSLSDFLNKTQQQQSQQPNQTPSTNANSGMGTDTAGSWGQTAENLVTGGQAGQDIAQAAYMSPLGGGTKQVNDIQQQALTNGQTLLQLAQKQTDNATKLKYSQMAADEFTRAGNVPEDIIGKVRSGEQVAGDMLGLLTNLAVGGGAIPGMEVNTGIANPILKAGAEGAIQG
ncbi:MAG TPA: hypothetical protein VNX68_15925, partial [Nitrosopumilaceae archaeon]|nr:hypothetical protein [Nitrosopumilaceae archaeon]